MKQVLVIPDVHGRKFWKRAVETHDSLPTVFLGDYVDPYPDDAISAEQTIENLKEVIEFAKNNVGRVQLLSGNHDLPYYTNFINSTRHDRIHHVEIGEIFFKNRQLFAFAHQIGDVLFTHAGLTSAYMATENVPTDADEINKMFAQRYERLMYVSRYRGGFSRCGSIVWADLREWFDTDERPEGVFQVFGHTQSRRPFIEKGHFAMLDVAGQGAFIMTIPDDYHEIDKSCFKMV